MNEIAYGCLFVGIAFLIISKLIGPVARWIEKTCERWLKWREVREAVRR